MNGTEGTNGTGPGPESTGPLSTKDAAVYFGITERAIRKRIHAGTLMGEQIAGQWVVYPQAVRQDHPARNPAQGRRTKEQRPWAEEPGPEPSAAAVMERLVSPLVAQIATQSAHIGDLREQLGCERTLREQAEAHAIMLERQLAARHAPPKEDPASRPTPAPPYRGTARSRVLRWLAHQLTYSLVPLM